MGCSMQCYRAESGSGQDKKESEKKGAPSFPRVEAIEEDLGEKVALD